MPGMKKMMYGTGGTKMKAYKAGGSLKPVPSDNKGLSKLPTEVRNKMGYMKHGGSVTKFTRKSKRGGRCI